MGKNVDVILTETLDEYYFAKFAPFFADREARGVTKGEAKAGKMMLLEFLRGKFNSVHLLFSAPKSRLHSSIIRIEKW